MRVLLLSPTSVQGGAERALSGLARRLPEFGWEPTAILLAPGPLEGWLADAGCPVQVLDTGRTRHLHRTAATLARLARRAREVDVVVSNQSKGHVYGGTAARLACRPAVWWQQGTPRQSVIESVAARVPASMVVASSVEAVAAQQRLTPTHRVELVHLGIDVTTVADRVGSGAVVRTHRRWHEATLVGIVGRLQEWKGQDVFLRAAARVAARHPEAVFVVVGGAVLGWEGDYPERLRRLAADLGIDDRVEFVGHQDDVYPWLDALDVVVHASYGEPFGLVLVEAMALGKALIATAAGGPLEIVEDGKSGLLVPPGDDEAMAGAIGKVLGDHALRGRLEVGAAKRAGSFDERRMAERMSSLLADAVGRQAPPVSSVRGLEERSVPGLHEHVFRHVVSRFEPSRAIDLGAGTGAFAERLAAAGFDVLAVDRDPSSFAATVPFRSSDFGLPDWEGELGPARWPLVTSLEVIEHLEAPIAFLRSIAALLSPTGRAVLTTPNVDSLPARLKFLLRGRLRMLDEHDDPTHISPIFWELLVRQYLPAAGLRLVHAETYPTDGFVAGRSVYRHLLQLIAPILALHPRLLGDNHVLVLAAHDRTTGGADWPDGSISPGTSASQ